MNDLIKTLRFMEHGTSLASAPVIKNAADEIERLRAEVDKLRLVIAHEGDCTQAADDECMRRGHQIEQLQKDNKHWQGIASQGIQIERTLRIEIERLRAELKWIADQRWNEDADLDDICTRADLAIAEPGPTAIRPAP